MNIGDLFLQLLADGSKLTQSVTKEAEKAGDAGAKTLNQRLGASLRTNGVKAFGIAAAGAFSLATKGALELEDVQADIIAQTGLGAEEAKRVASSVNRVAGETRLALDNVKGIAIGVHNDLGLTGDAADAMTLRIAKFAQVTKIDGVQAVTLLDDVTDAWSLTTQQQATVLDQLLVSQQKYGGSISENAAALSRMAPQLQALNADYNDGIAILNLFAASGVDASKAQAALNTAVSRLKPGQGLDDLVTQVSSIEDPTKRAQKAIELFGAKGGVALANALKPGVDSLDQFGVSGTEAGDAVNKAAEVLDSTFSGRVQKAISQATAAVREFGASFGSALTGAAAIASLLSTTGLGGGLSKVLGKAWKTAAASSVVSSAISFAGDKAATVYLKSLFAKDAVAGIATKLGASMAAAIDMVPGSSKVSGALDKAGGLMGSKLGKAFGVAFAAVAVAEAVQTYFTVRDQLAAQSAALVTQAQEFTKTATKAQIDAALATAKQQMVELMKTRLITESIPFIGGAVTTSTDDALNNLQKTIDELEAASGKAGESIPRAIAEGVEAGLPAVDRSAASLVTPFTDAQRELLHKSEAAGRAVDAGFAQGVLDRQGKIRSAFDDLKNLMENALGRRSRIAETIGILTSERLAKGLRDRRGVVRRQAAFVASDAEQRLATMIARGGVVGEKAMEELKKGLHSKDPVVRAEAQRVQEIVTAKLQGTIAPARNAGRSAGAAYARALLSPVNAALRKVLVGGPSGFSTAAKQADGHASGGVEHARMPRIIGERGWEVFVPPTNGYTVSHAEAVDALAGAGGVGGDTFNIPIHVTGVLRAETPDDVARPMRQIVTTGIVRSRRSRSRVEVPTRVQ